MSLLNWLFPLVFQLLTALANPFLNNLPALGWEPPDRAPDLLGAASRYGGSADGLGGSGLAGAPNHRIEVGDHVCAHRKLPHGTVLLIRSKTTKKATVCVVRDRGPFGACKVKMGKGRKCPKGSWFAKVGDRKKEPGEYRGILDIAFTAFAELGETGLADVEVWKLYTPPPKRVRPRRANA